MDLIKRSLHKILKIIDELENEYSKYDRRFTLDGHLLGSMAEVYAAEKYGLKLLKSSEKGHDAIDEKNNLVQIKVTQRNSVGIRHEPKKLLVLKLNRKTYDFEEVYYGNGAEPWEMSNKKNSAGQRIITLNKLREINKKSP